MDYTIEVKKSLAYIENNLDRYISLDELASTAFCSRFHYQRAFKAVVGETVMGYIRKKRLKKAAFLLLKTDRFINDIAFECGFEFHESFTRSFKRQYGFAPMEYRRNKKTFITCDKLDLIRRKPLIEKPAGLSGPVIVDGTCVKFAGIRCLTTIGENYEQRVVSRLWEELSFKLGEINNRIDANAVYGIGFHNSSQKLGYFACVKVEKIERLPRGIEGKIVPPLKYARFTHEGPDMDVVDSLDFIFGRWLTEKRHQLANDINFIARMDESRTAKGKPEVDIYIPIK